MLFRSGSWPAISPVSPGVLCALGDATTRMRTETARSFSRLARETQAEDLITVLDEMATQTRAELRSDGVPEAEISSLIVELRSATAGVGTFSSKFDHLSELTGRAADQVVTQAQARAAA